MNIQDLDRALAQMSDKELSSLADQIVRVVEEGTFFHIWKMELILTEECMFRCDYCFVEGKNADHKMNSRTALSAVEFLIRQSGKSNSIELTLFGGEPLLEFDLCSEIVQYATRSAGSAEKTVIWSITTNGFLLDHKKLSFFAQNGINLLLSLDGNRESNDAHRRLADGGPTFDLVFPKIELMKRYQGWLGVRMTINPDTVDNLAEDVRFLHNAGINQFLIGSHIEAEWTPETIESYRSQYEAVARYYIEEQAKDDGIPLRMAFFEDNLDKIKRNCTGKWGCEAGRDKVCISARGKIFPCSKFNGMYGLEGGYLLGDLENGIVAHPMRAELHDNRKTIRGKCLFCDYADYCTGGCPADNLRKNGSIFAPDETVCVFKQTRIDLIRKMPEISEAHTLREKRMQEKVKPLKRIVPIVGPLK